MNDTQKPEHYLVQELMELETFAKHAKRTVPKIDGPMMITVTHYMLPLFCLGLAGEVGEVIELIKKHLFHGHELNVEKVKEEMGDTMWYLVGLADTCGIDLREALHFCIEKLDERYEDGFSEEASQNRKR